MKLKKGDTVRCVDSESKCKSLTLGKTYEVLDTIDEQRITVVNDYNKIDVFYAIRFVLEELKGLTRTEALHAMVDGHKVKNKHGTIMAMNKLDEGLTAVVIVAHTNKIIGSYALNRENGPFEIVEEEEYVVDIKDDTVTLSRDQAELLLNQLKEQL